MSGRYWVGFGVFLVAVTVGGLGWYSIQVYNRPSGPLPWFLFQYWQSIVGGTIATVAGLLLGLPLAISVNNYATKVSTKSSLDQAERSEYEKRSKLYGLLHNELNNSLPFLKRVAEGKVELLRVSTAIWQSASLSGDLGRLSDTEVISCLVEAYDGIEVVNSLLSAWLSNKMRNDGADTGLEILTAAAQDSVAKVASAIDCINHQLNGESL